MFVGKHDHPVRHEIGRHQLVVSDSQSDMLQSSPSALTM